MLACASVCVFSTQFKHVGSSFGKRWKCKVDKFVKVFILSMYAKELKVYSLQKVEFLQYHNFTVTMSFKYKKMIYCFINSNLKHS